jgi:hypothetical protein
MLADAAGRWVNAHNARRFAELALHVAQSAAEAGATPSEILFDLEPAIDRVRAWLASPIHGAGEIARAARHDGSAELADLSEQLRARGWVVSSALVPLVAFDRPGEPGYQALFATPVDPIGFDHASVMLYTSILEGWSRGVVDRSVAREILAEGTRVAAARFGESAGVSVGAIGVGAFGDEPTYRSPAELADDVAIARASGVDDLTLLDLGGVLARPPARAWLDAFTRTPALDRELRTGPKAFALLLAARLAGRVIAHWTRYAQR